MRQLSHTGTIPLKEGSIVHLIGTNIFYRITPTGPVDVSRTYYDFPELALKPEVVNVYNMNIKTAAK